MVKVEGSVQMLKVKGIIQKLKMKGSTDDEGDMKCTDIESVQNRCLR